MTQHDLETSLNGICPYFTMFPLDFPYNILKKHASPGQWVLDPFCGRGTTNFAARRLGLNSVGIDSSLVAVAITQSKLVMTSPAQIADEANHILETSASPKDLPVGEFWDWAYHQEVLVQLCVLREALLAECTSDVRKALRGILLGGLHGPYGKSIQSYLSNQCQRTYAPKPRYAVNFWKKHGYRPKKINILDVIKRRAERYYSLSLSAISAEVHYGDSRNSELFRRITEKIKADWIITSPPYYGMKTYIPDQWLRNWFVGGPSHVTYSGYEQLEHSSPSVFSEQLRTVWQNIEVLSGQETHLVLRFGAINDRKADPIAMIRESFKETGWQLITRRSAGLASQGKRQSLHFGTKSTVAIEEHDYWARRI